MLGAVCCHYVRRPGSSVGNGALLRDTSVVFELVTFQLPSQVPIDFATTAHTSVACTTKPVQQTLDIFELSGLANPNKRDLAKRSYDAGYQLGKSTQGFSVRLRARERGGVSNI